MCRPEHRGRGNPTFHLETSGLTLGSRVGVKVGTWTLRGYSDLKEGSPDYPLGKLLAALLGGVPSRDD